MSKYNTPTNLECVAHGPQHHAEQRREDRVAKLVRDRGGDRAHHAHDLVTELDLRVDDGLNPRDHLETRRHSSKNKQKKLLG